MRAILHDGREAGRVHGHRVAPRRDGAEDVRAVRRALAVEGHVAARRDGHGGERVVARRDERGEGVAREVVADDAAVAALVGAEDEERGVAALDVGERRQRRGREGAHRVADDVEDLIRVWGIGRHEDVRARLGDAGVAVDEVRRREGGLRERARRGGRELRERRGAVGREIEVVGVRGRAGDEARVHRVAHVVEAAAREEDPREVPVRVEVGEEGVAAGVDGHHVRPVERQSVRRRAGAAHRGHLRGVVRVAHVEHRDARVVVDPHEVPRRVRLHEAPVRVRALGDVGVATPGAVTQ